MRYSLLPVLIAGHYRPVADHYRGINYAPNSCKTAIMARIRVFRKWLESV